MKPTWFMSKATLVPQRNPSHNSITGLHVPSRPKKNLQSYCSVDFIRFDMTFDVTLRDGISFG